MFNPAATSEAFHDLPLLLIVNVDIVSYALAQHAGGNIGPVISFGWVGYAFSALVSAGRGRLMPISPDYPCTVIDGNTGFAIENKSWMLGRIMRDFPVWMSHEVTEKLKRMQKEKMYDLHDENPETQWILSTSPVGLCVSIYEPHFTLRAGFPTRDLTYFEGSFVAVLQLGIASIPCGIYRDWSVLLLTAAGSLLASVTAWLPDWRREKFACSRDSRRTSIITTPGGQHAIVVLGTEHELDLQDLAMSRVGSMTYLTRVIVFTLAVFWVAFLITASNEGVGSWFLVAVGAVGTLHDWYVGSVPRRPSAYRIHLRLKDVIGRPGVMETLYELEERFPRLGKSLLQSHFQGNLQKDQLARWQELEDTTQARHEAQKMSFLMASTSGPLARTSSISGRVV